MLSTRQAGGCISRRFFNLKSLLVLGLSLTGGGGGGGGSGSALGTRALGALRLRNARALSSSSYLLRAPSFV